MRHPQYVAFVLVLTGFLLQWPTLLPLISFPVLVWAYARLARREEKDCLSRFGDDYASYMQAVPAFLQQRPRGPAPSPGARTGRAPGREGVWLVGVNEGERGLYKKKKQSKFY